MDEFLGKTYFVSYHFPPDTFAREGLTCFKIEMFENGVFEMAQKDVVDPFACAALFETNPEIVRISAYKSTSKNVATFEKFSNGSGFDGQFAVREDPAVITGSEFRFLEVGNPFTAELLFPSCTAPSASPLEASVMSSLALGYFFTCALNSYGEISCWGRNIDGEIGVGEGKKIHEPTLVSLGTKARGAVMLASGGFHACAVDTLQELWCWGNNKHGQVGDGTFVDRRFTPTAVSLDSGVLELALGNSHTCVIDADLRLLCWGNNAKGQLGPEADDLREFYPVNVSVGRYSFAVQISLGLAHSCVIDDADLIKCWGSNEFGQLGHGTTEKIQISPRVVSLGSEPLKGKQITAGAYHTCAIDTLDDLKCWGANGFGQLGDGTTEKRLTPTSVTLGGTSYATRVVVGHQHSCAIDNFYVLKCWGNNSSGAIGDGTNTYRDTPTTVSTISNVSFMDLGAFHTCAYNVEDVTRCWGDNNFGQLGDSTNNAKNTAATVTFV